jgi:NAD(P)H-quinone oxidoreductase subunit 5
MDHSLFSPLLIGVPLLTALGGSLVFYFRTHIEKMWTVAQGVLALGFLLALLGAARMPSSEAFVPSVMMILVTTIAWVIARFSKSFLSGLAQQHDYLAAFLFTVAGVELVIASNHLGVMALAWAMSSVFLHRLLTFFGNRPAAVWAARKKFIASRFAEGLLLGAIALLWESFGTLNVSDIATRVDTLSSVPMSVQVAAVLLTLAVVVKSAQLPLHGWLLQVMEAPTPVSALLHAGVVNLGGFVLIRMATLISAVPMAQAVLVVAGSVTAVIAALVMTTRVSIKVKLAWSTCAQMGFMLVECGLGFYELALVHLVGHSLYKAHAFLSSGSVVSQTRITRLATPASGGSWKRQTVSLALSLALLFLAWRGGSLLFPSHPVPLGLVLIFGFAVFPLLTQWANLEWREQAVSIFVTLIFFGFAIGIHTLLSPLLNLPAPIGPMHSLLLAWFSVWFVMMGFISILCSTKNAGPFARKAYPWIFGGLFLDELFTRFTVAVWGLLSARGGSEKKKNKEPNTPALTGEST